MTTSPPTIGGDTDAIRRYAAEIRAHGEDVYLSVREHTRNVRNSFIAEASAHTRDGGIAPVYEELKTSLFAVMDRLDDAAAVIRQEQEDTARELEDAARDFDQHDDDAAARLGQIGTVDLASGPPTVTKPAPFTGPVGGPAPTDTRPFYLADHDATGGPAPTDTRPYYLTDRGDVADALGGAIGETPGGHSMTMAGMPGGVPLHAETDTRPYHMTTRDDVADTLDDAIDHDQHDVHVTGLPGGVPGPRIIDTRPTAATPPDYRFDV